MNTPIQHKMMTRKPGPPVPPRPNTGLLLKNRSESPTSRSTVVTSAPSKISSSDTGRTVIYKSPSFDLKQRQLHKQQQEYSQDLTSQAQSYEQQQKNEMNTDTIKQQSILISETQKYFRSDRIHNESSAHTRQLDNGNVMIENKSNRTEIVIRNNKKVTLKNGTDSDNNNVGPNIDREDEGKKLDKVSPVPKPRTSIPSRTGSKNCSDNGVVRSNSDHRRVSKSEITIKNDIIENTVNNNNNNNNSNCNKSIDLKNLEMENNIKNVAERLFTEIIINNQSKINEDNVAKTEHCISVRSPPSTISKNTASTNNRTRVNLSHRPEPEGGENKPLEMTNFQRSFENKISTEKKVAFHEILISELAAMRNKNSVDNGNSNEHDYSDHDYDHGKHQDGQQKQQRKRYPSGCSTDSSPYGTHRSRIRTSDWVEVGDNGKEVMLTSCHISLEDSGLEDEERLDDMSSGVGDSWDSVKDAEERMSLPGLPPLPKSLSGLDSSGVPVHNSTGSLASLESQRGISPISRMTTTTGGGTTTTSTLDTQLAVLRREMFGLRQLDLSLLSQLWALNESIQEFRTMLQEQETLSPPSPSPSPSDANSVSSDAEDDIPLSLGKSQLPPSAMQRMRSAPPPPPPTRKAPQRPV